MVAGIVVCTAGFSLSVIYLALNAWIAESTTEIVAAPFVGLMILIAGMMVLVGRDLLESASSPVAARAVYSGAPLWVRRLATVAALAGGVIWFAPELVAARPEPAGHMLSPVTLSAAGLVLFSAGITLFSSALNRVDGKAHGIAQGA